MMLQLEIFTPKRSVLRVSCDRVQLPGLQGQMTVLPGHSTLLAQLGAGTIYVQGKQQAVSDNDATSATKFGKQQDRTHVAIAAGFAWVQDNRVRVLCDEPSLS